MTLQDEDGHSSVADEKKRRLFEVLRWIGVVPCASLAGKVAGGLGYGALRIFRGPGYPDFLYPLLQYLPGGLALTFVAGMVAPKRRLTVAFALAGLLMFYSWQIHVIAQRSPGLVNYMHATGESLGALIGVALVSRRLASTKESEAPTDAVSDDDRSE